MCGGASPPPPTTTTHTHRASPSPTPLLATTSSSESPPIALPAELKRQRSREGRGLLARALSGDGRGDGDEYDGESKDSGGVGGEGGGGGGDVAVTAERRGKDDGLGMAAGAAGAAGAASAGHPEGKAWDDEEGGVEKEYYSPSTSQHGGAQPKKTIPRPAPYDGPADALWKMCKSSRAPDMTRFAELIDAGIDVRYKTFSGTALHWASLQGHIDAVRALVAADPSVEHLRMRGEGKSGSTALMYASTWGNTAIARELIAADPSVEHLQMRDNSGKTALDRAIATRRYACEDLLRAAAAAAAEETGGVRGDET